jgi:hypothetical protein
LDLRKLAEVPGIIAVSLWNRIGEISFAGLEPRPVEIYHVSSPLNEKDLLKLPKILKSKPDSLVMEAHVLPLVGYSVNSLGISAGERIDAFVYLDQCPYVEKQGISFEVEPESPPS